MVSLPQPCPKCQAPVYNYSCLCGACGYTPRPTKVTVPVALLEHCLGVIESMAMDFQASASFAEDIRLAVGQLRANIPPPN